MSPPVSAAAAGVAAYYPYRAVRQSEGSFKESVLVTYYQNFVATPIAEAINSFVEEATAALSTALTAPAIVDRSRPSTELDAALQRAMQVVIEAALQLRRSMLSALAYWPDSSGLGRALGAAIEDLETSVNSKIERYRAPDCDADVDSTLVVKARVLSNLVRDHHPGFR